MKKKSKISLLIILIIILIILSIFIIHYVTTSNKEVQSFIIESPSIKISLNKKEKVLKVEPLNEESSNILKDTTFKKDSLDNTLNKLLDLLIKEGCIDNNSYLLLSNENISSKALNIIKDKLSKENISSEIIIQDITDNALSNAQEYNITSLKASYIENIIKENNTITFEDLKDKSITEINTYVKKVQEELEEAERLRVEEEKKKQEEAQKQQETNKQDNQSNIVATDVSEEFKKKQEELQNLMNQYTGEEDQIKELMSKLNVVALGDSVMLGAEMNLKKLFPNIYFDAALNRNGSHIRNILQTLSAAGTLGDPIVISAGSNGDCKESVKDTIMSIAGSREVFWVTVTNDYNVHVNDKLKAYASKYPNLHIIDWEAISAGHSEYLYKDGVHLPPAGRTAYANAIYYEIYKVYKAKFNDLLDEKKNDSTTTETTTQNSTEEPIKEDTTLEYSDKVEEKNETPEVKD